MTSKLELLGAAAAALGLLAAGAWWRYLRMPGRSLRGGLPPLSAGERELSGRLRAHVQALAGDIGPRNTEHPEGYTRAREYVRQQFEGIGLVVEAQEYPSRGVTVANLIADLPGREPGPPVVLGAHYDSCLATPGADDNASGVAALIELGRRFRGTPPAHPVRLVAFANEEPPFFQTEEMGSLIHARHLRERGEEIRGMLSLEMLGDFRDEPGSQLYPPGLAPLFPPQGDFIAFVADASRGAWLREVLGAFRRHATLPSEGIAAPRGVVGIDLSDHWAFWQVGYPALMVTDGGPFRNTRYHQLDDTPETLDYERFARVVEGLAGALDEL